MQHQILHLTRGGTAATLVLERRRRVRGVSRRWPVSATEAAQLNDYEEPQDRVSHWSCVHTAMGPASVRAKSVPGPRWPSATLRSAGRAGGDGSGRKASPDPIATHDLAETAMKADAGLRARVPPSRCAPSSCLACFALRGTGARGGVYAHPGPGPSGMGRSVASEPYASLSDAWRSKHSKHNQQ